MRYLRIFFFFSFLGALNASEYLVKWKTAEAFEVGAPLLNVILNKRFKNIDFENVSLQGRLRKYSVDTADDGVFLNFLKVNQDIEYVVQNKKFSIKMPVANLKTQKQWSLEKVNAFDAWKLAQTKGSKSIILAILDTGVDSQHESLRDNVIDGYDFKDNDNDPSDVTSVLNPGHGTHCAGIVGALGNLNHAIIGMMPQVSILPVRILGRDGGGNMDDAVQGIDYAISRGAHVISASWSGEMLPSEAAPLVEAIQRAEAAGITFVTSAGNGDENGDGYNIDYLNIYPASVQLSNVISVGATDEIDLPTQFSNFGRKKVHIAAPGFKILSTLPGNKYGELSGTSMSTPLVAGLAAFLKHLDTSLKPHEIKALLQSSGSKIDMRTACSCRIDAWSAVDMLVNKKPFVVPNSVTLNVGEKKIFSLKNSEAKTFTLNDPKSAYIKENGELEAKASGFIQVQVQDSSWNEYSSGSIRIKEIGEPQEDPGDLEDGNEDPYACPYANPDECQAACEEHFGLPWCPID